MNAADYAIQSERLKSKIRDEKIRALESQHVIAQRRADTLRVREDIQKHNLDAVGYQEKIAKTNADKAVVNLEIAGEQLSQRQHQLTEARNKTHVARLATDYNRSIYESSLSLKYFQADAAERVSKIFEMARIWS